MKSHISATIDAKLVVELNRVGQEERRSRSQLIEMALEAFLRGRNDTRDEIITSEGRFEGSFSREETMIRERIPVILTENVRDFSGVEGIQPINPYC